MKKGNKYNISLIYALLFTKGSGFIDFNGDKKESGNTPSPTDQLYEKVIEPEKDMDYVITIHQDTSRDANVCFKLGYNMKNGGIAPEVVELEKPIVLPAPESETTSISGTAITSNTITVKDIQSILLGTARVGKNGKYEVKTNRYLKYNEKLLITQKMKRWRASH